MEIALLIHMVGIIFLAPYKGTRESGGNMMDKIILEGEGKNRGNILLHSTLRAGVKIENLFCILQMSFDRCH